MSEPTVDEVVQKIPKDTIKSKTLKFLSEDAQKMIKSIEEGGFKLKEKITSKDQKVFNSLFIDEFEDYETVIRLEDFNPDIDGIVRVEKEVIKELKQFYKGEVPLPLESFIALFVKRLKNDPKIKEGQNHYSVTSKQKYYTSNIMMFIKESFRTMYVGISGSASDRRSQLIIRPKWYYEYLICAMEYCTQLEKEIMDEVANENNVNLIQWDFRIDLDADFSVRYFTNRTPTIMVKEAGFVSYNNIRWREMFKVYIAILKNLIDKKEMAYWPEPMVPHGCDAWRYNNIFDLFLASAKMSGFFDE